MLMPPLRTSKGSARAVRTAPKLDLETTSMSIRSSQMEQIVYILVLNQISRLCVEPSVLRLFLICGERPPTLGYQSSSGSRIFIHSPLISNPPLGFQIIASITLLLSLLLLFDGILNLFKTGN